jgi:phosphonate C-P lyase system protein PhnG
MSDNNAPDKKTAYGNNITQTGKKAAGATAADKAGIGEDEIGEDESGEDEIGETGISEAEIGETAGVATGLDRKRFSRALYHMPRQALLDLAASLQARYPVRLVKEPGKILIMTSIREPLRRTNFHLGEALASEASVELNGYNGCAVFMGDDLEKTLAAAVVDCARNAQIPEWAEIEAALLRREQQRQQEIAAETALLRHSKVDFRPMDRREADAEKTRV